MSVLYHFTDTAKLPWILKARELQPGHNSIGGYPNPDFLWATTSALGDRTASGMASPKAYRAGMTRHVRFTLERNDFIPWAEIRQRCPAWTPDQIERLERCAKSSPSTWWCRVNPLPSSRWISIETRSYFAPTWKPLMAPRVVGNDDGELGIVVGGEVYLSRQIGDVEGAAIYRVTVGKVRVMTKINELRMTRTRAAARAYIATDPGIQATPGSRRDTTEAA